MLKRASAVGIILVLAILGGGATEAVPNVEVDNGPSQDQSLGNDTVVEHDDLFAQVAAMVSGFGGMFLDESGAVNVYLLDLTQEEAAKAAIASVFGPERFPLGEVRVLQGGYGFLQLYEWREGLRRDVLGMPGVSSLDLTILRIA